VRTVWWTKAVTIIQLIAVICFFYFGSFPCLSWFQIAWCWRNYTIVKNTAQSADTRGAASPHTPPPLGPVYPCLPCWVTVVLFVLLRYLLNVSRNVNKQRRVRRSEANWYLNVEITHDSRHDSSWRWRWHYKPRGRRPYATLITNEILLKISLFPAPAWCTQSTMINGKCLSIPTGDKVEHE